MTTPLPTNPPLTDVQIQYEHARLLQALLDKPTSTTTIESATISQSQVAPTGGPVPAEASYTGVRAPDGTLVPLLGGADGRLLVDTGLVIPQPQTDALTDAQLRSAPVPVATGLTTQTDALTDVQLRAAPVPVDTGLAIPAPQTDALTNVELRAAPVPVDTGLTIPAPQTDTLTDAQLRASRVPVRAQGDIEDAYEKGMQRFGSVEQAIAAGGSGHLMLTNPSTTHLVRIFAVIIGSSAACTITYRRDAALVGGTVVQEYNPNRQFSDDSPATLERGTSLTGGVAVATGRQPTDVPFHLPLTTDLLPGQSYSISASAPALGNAFTLFATAFFLVIPLA